jgi:hypothetical protein
MDEGEMQKRVGHGKRERERRENEWLRRLVASVISLPSGRPD